MAAPDAAVLGANLRRLGDRGFAGFVADLWTARGYDVAREDDCVLAVRDGESVVIHPSTTGRVGTDRPVDVLVTPRSVSDTHGADRVVDAAGLRDALWYALDRETAARLCRHHLGAEPTALRLPPSRRLRGWLSGVATVAADEGSTARAAVLAVLGLLVVAGAVAGLGAEGLGGGGEPTLGGIGGGAGGDAHSPDAATATATAAATDGTPTPADAAAGDVAGVDRVPGLDAGGVTDRLELVGAHERALANRSYTLWVDTVGPRDGVPDATRVRHDVDIVVAGERYRLVDTAVVGDQRTRVRDVYHDGTDLYVADGPVGNATVSVRRNASATTGSVDPRLFADTIVLRALTTVRTEVTGRERRGDLTVYRVVGHGKPSAGRPGRVGNYTVVAHVAPSGLVVDGRVSYVVETADGPVPLSFEWRYDRIDRTTVDSPLWATEANGTDATPERVRVVNRIG